MQRKAGSYVIDDSGELQPNPDDEAMTARRKKDESAEGAETRKAEDAADAYKKKRR